MDPISGPQTRFDREDEEPEGEGLLVPPVESVNLGIDPEALEPLAPATRIVLSEGEEEEFSSEIEDFLWRYDRAMQERIERWIDIESAYNLVVDPQTVGPMPHAQRTVSEMMRVHTNITTARVKGSLMSSDPIMLFKAWFDQDSDEETQRAVSEAEATQEFFHRYFFHVMKAKTWFPIAIHRANKIGASVVRVRWETKRKISWFKNPAAPEGWEQRKPEIGRVVCDLIPNAQVKLWPLHGLSIRDLQIVGHDSYESAPSFRVLAKRLKLDPDIRDQVLSRAKAMSFGDGSGDDRRQTEEDLRGKDLNVTDLLAFRGEVPITELWLQDYLLPGAKEPGNYQLFYYRPLRKVLGIFSNPYRSQCHPYFLFPHSREDNCVWSSGVGHELMYAQKTDSALWNMLLDNLKVVGNVLRIVESGSLAEAHQDEIMPGGTLVVDSMENFDTKELGGDLSWIVNVLAMNQQRGKLSTRVTNPEAGMADEVLKSGASPGSIAQLREGSGSHFKEVDENIRGALVDLCQFSLELLQQYAPTDLYYAYASEEKAGALVRAKFSVPEGDLASRFRISPKAPSATDNKEIMLQRLMLTFQMLQNYLPMAMQVADMVLAPTNPDGAQQFKEAAFRFLNNDVFQALIENQEISGIGGKVPQVGPPTPENERMNQAIQIIQQLQEQLMMVSQQMQGAAGGVSPPPSSSAPPVGPVPNV